jgi:hypothetical protein
MENIEFDIEKIIQMTADKMVLNMATAAFGSVSDDPKMANSIKDIMTVFINHGIRLDVALDILKDVSEILTKQMGDADHG